MYRNGYNTGSGLLIVGCPVRGCRWRRAVSYWALGPTLAASTVVELMNEHLETEHPEWNS